MSGSKYVHPVALPCQIERLAAGVQCPRTVAYRFQTRGLGAFDVCPGHVGDAASLLLVGIRCRHAIVTPLGQDEQYAPVNIQAEAAATAATGEEGC